MFRSCVLAATIAVLCGSNAIAQNQNHVDRDQLAQNVKTMLGDTPDARVIIMGTAANSTADNEIVYFAYSMPNGPNTGWYDANCTRLAEGGWICVVAPVGRAFIQRP